MKNILFIIFITHALKLPAQNKECSNPFAINTKDPSLKEYVNTYRNLYGGNKFAYFPDEDKTYVVETIKTWNNEEGFSFALQNVRAIRKGWLLTALAPEITPNGYFTVEMDKKRKALVNANGTVHHYTCAYPGKLCVILWNDE